MPASGFSRLAMSAQQPGNASRGSFEGGSDAYTRNERSIDTLRLHRSTECVEKRTGGTRVVCTHDASLGDKRQATRPVRQTVSEAHRQFRFAEPHHRGRPDFRIHP